MVVRTAVMDEIILRCVRQGAATVLNLAAGLDARPYRLALPATLRWLHVDLPDMVEYFRSHMATETPRCRLEFIAADAGLPKTISGKIRRVELRSAEEDAGDGRSDSEYREDDFPDLKG